MSRLSGRHHRRELRQEQAQQPAAAGDRRSHRDRRGAERDEHRRGDSSDEDRAGKADHERAPPVARLRQTAADVVEFVLSLHRHIRHSCSFRDSQISKNGKLARDPDVSNATSHHNCRRRYGASGHSGRLCSDRPAQSMDIWPIPAATQLANALLASSSAIASEEVAAGDGALRTQTTPPSSARQKSSTSEPSRSSACARIPAGARTTTVQLRTARTVRLPDERAFQRRALQLPEPGAPVARDMRQVPGQQTVSLTSRSLTADRPYPSLASDRIALGPSRRCRRACASDARQETGALDREPGRSTPSRVRRARLEAASTHPGTGRSVAPPTALKPAPGGLTAGRRRRSRGRRRARTRRRARSGRLCGRIAGPGPGRPRSRCGSVHRRPAGPPPARTRSQGSRRSRSRASAGRRRRMHAARLPEGDRPAPIATPERRWPPRARRDGAAGRSDRRRSRPQACRRRPMAGPARRRTRAADRYRDGRAVP